MSGDRQAEILRENGITMLGAGRYRDAAAFLQQSLALAPDDAKAQNCLGIAYQNTNMLAQAEESFRQAIALKPDYEGAYSNLVSVLERRNDIAKARAFVEEAKRLFPGGRMITLNEALVLKREGRLQEAIDLLETGHYPPDPMTRLKVKHELGLMYDRLGRVAEAFAVFQDFNAYAAQVFGITAQSKAPYLEKIAHCRQVFTPEWVSSWREIPPAREAGRPPVCLMGFMRSGTTLLQHILNAHPAIYASEEVHAFPVVEKEIRGNYPAYPECLAGFDAADIAAFRRRYFEIHRQAQDWISSDWREAEMLVDKYPMLANMAGLVHRMFPDMKYIFVRRHPCDCVLSVYMQLFVPNEASVHFYNLEDAVTLYTRFMDLWAVYEAVLPLDVHDVRYEDVTADFRETIGGVLDFLGLPWDDSVLDYDRKVRECASVISPSYAQVSEKIYDRARYRWWRYREYLAPYLDRLAPYAARFGYDMDGED